MAVTKEKLNLIPDNPGVYIMKDRNNQVIYVGKAKSLKKRVRQYFQSSASHNSPKVKVMVDRINDIEFILTDSEIEALILECNLIKEYRPKYNVMLKDDKSYPYIKVTVNEEYPRIFLTRDVKREGAKYFGPYTNVSAVRQTIDIIKKLFPIRTCKKNIKFGSKNGRPCLNYHIKQCMAPCQGNIDKKEYNDMIKHIILFLDGRYNKLLDKMYEQMREAARLLNFEKAASIRDKITAIENIMQKQKVLTNDFEDQDIVAYAADQGFICFQLLFVRNGKLIGTKHFIIENDYYTDIQEVFASFIKQYYSQKFVPKHILLQSSISEQQLISEWLTQKRGNKVYLKVPMRGEKKQLIKLAQKNASQTLNDFINRKQWEADRTEGAVRELQQLLSLKKLPVRIEAFDISNIQGTQSVGSMVVFEGGKPAKKEYRRFKIKTIEGVNDFASIAEIVRRRYKNSDKMPDLILIDGGKGQLNAAVSVLKDLGKDSVQIIGLAKKFEEIYFPNQKQPIMLPNNSNALHLIQRIRDEAHRFAITFHRSLRQKSSVKSVLDDIEGIGPKRKKILLEHMQSIDKIRQASLEDLTKIPGIGKSAAQKVYEFFNKNY